MKKSELYHLAQVAVLQSSCISPEGKLPVLRLLFENEDVALYTEKRDEEKNATTDVVSNK